MQALAVTRLTSLGGASRIRFERAGSEMNPAFDRYLVLDGRRAYKVGNVCDTCEFFFERLDGANEKVSPSGVGDHLRRGLDELDDELLSTIGRALPDGDYTVMLLDLVPTLVQPGSPADYFSHEQIALWGIDSFWNLAHNPRTEYYRGAALPLGGARQLFEFVVPIMPSNWLDAATVSVYEDRLRAQQHPTALAVSLLDVKQPADWDGEPAVTEHWCLAHYLLDGHHKTLAAARAGAPLRLLSLLAVGEGVPTGEHVERVVSALAQPS